MAGGFTTNAIWCIYLIKKNNSAKDYTQYKSANRFNYILAISAGLLWYCQFMFYGMGATKMGEHDYASWTLHMAFIIIFSSVIGLITKEWRNSGKPALKWLILGLAVLIASTILVGYGNTVGH